MKKSRFSDIQILPILKQAENSVPVPELCREHGRSRACFFKWRAKYGGMDTLPGVVVFQLWGNRTIRYDWLAQYLFDGTEEVQDYSTRWLLHYSHERPNMGLGGITPQQKLAVMASRLLFNPAKNGGITKSLTNL